MTDKVIDLMGALAASVAKAKAERKRPLRLVEPEPERWPHFAELYRIGAEQRSRPGRFYGKAVPYDAPLPDHLRSGLFVNKGRTGGHR